MAENDVTPVEIAGNTNLESPYAAFQADLEGLINQHSIENLTDTPDFILAEYMVENLRALAQHHRACKAWHSPEMQAPTIQS